MQDPRKSSEPATSEDERRHQDELLDEALEESFPASDPPSMTDPHGHATPANDKR